MDIDSSLANALSKDATLYKVLDKTNLDMIRPKTKWLERWQVFIVMLVIYTDTYYIYKVTFIDQPHILQIVIDTIVDFSFFIDIILTFFLVKDQYWSVYLKSWFLPDLQNMIPYQLFWL